ncbi:MAG: helix-hairpin-helix domain-containing protein [Methylobacteriaceae bacterium]|nr:helix-hairpin-helix domain-containing protein [Methylobacteriaceae bacterium]
MISKRLIASAAALALSFGAAYAQTAQPAQPARPATPPPAAAAPAKPATPAAAPAAAAKPATPAAKKTNLNTAAAEELDKLPQIGPARAKSIMEARAKAKFKNWDDFVARNVVPKNAEDSIKDLVSF